MGSPYSKLPGRSFVLANFVFKRLIVIISLCLFVFIVLYHCF